MDGVDILHLEHREKSEMDYSFFFLKVIGILSVSTTL